MTARVEWFCDSCNPGAQQPHVSHRGYEITPLGETPEGWWEVPGMGLHKGHPGHVCGDCIRTRPGIVEKIAEARGASLADLM